jgi:hypothetical protein
MKAYSLLIAAASLAGFEGVNGNAQPVGTMISPGIFIRPSGIFQKSSGVTFNPSGLTFNSFGPPGVPFGINQSSGFFPESQSGFTPERSGHGFFTSRRFGFGIDEAILQERAIRQSGTTIGRQDTIAIGPQSGGPAVGRQDTTAIGPQSGGPAIGRQDTTAIGPQSGGPAISPDSASRHIREQEKPRNPVGGGGVNALGGKGAGHGGGGGQK